MSEDKVQSAQMASEQPANAPEVANESQDQPAQPNAGELIAESKKYRARSQSGGRECRSQETDREQSAEAVGRAAGMADTR